MFRKMKLPIAFLLMAILSVSCEREFDSPPIPEISEGGLISLADLRAMHTGMDLKITDTLSVYAVVSMDESSGNLYKEAYVQDATASMYLRFTAASGLYEGDSIRILLTGTTLKNYNQMLQLDSLDADKNIFKQATQVGVTAEATNLADIAVNGSYYQSRLVRLEGVEFSCEDLGLTFADGVNQESENRYLQDVLGNQLIVRTSGYANFADQEVPSLSGSVTAIVSQYNDDVQLLLRHPDELVFTEDRMDDCDGNTGGGSENTILSKDFDDQSVTSGGWMTQLVSGPSNCDWGIYAGTNSAAKVTNWDGTNNSACESWLISPAVDLSGTNPLLSFRNTYNYSGDPLKVFVSIDYNGGDPTTANWTELTNVVWSPGSWEWASSGDIDLAAYAATNVHIGFVYTGSDSDGSTWELDDITIVDNQ